MPVLQAAGWPRHERWRDILNELCTSTARTPGFLAGFDRVCEAHRAVPAGRDRGAGRLSIAARMDGVDASSAPFLMAALQVYWAAMAATLASRRGPESTVRGVCPVCGSCPVSSIVRLGSAHRDTGICIADYVPPSGTWSESPAVIVSRTKASLPFHRGWPLGRCRAESCGQCHTYRKILYQEKDTDVDPSPTISQALRSIC